ncbi:MAG TPA: transglutaminase family protein [Casimicrobiaceae bacterium]
MSYEKMMAVSRIFHIDCELEYQVTRQSVFVFNLAVSDSCGQLVLREAFNLHARGAVDEFRDAGRLNRYMRIDSCPGPLIIRYQATVEVEPPAIDECALEVPVALLPGDVLPYLRGSRYCESDRIFSLACREFERVPHGYRRVLAICQWIRKNIDYKLGTSSPATTACDTLTTRAGVCRDFAHLAISFCRALNIPARFVTAYACYREPPPDFHALFEAYLGGRWCLFDPTELARLDETVRIGTGLDASDVAFATYFGAAALRRLSPLIEPQPAVTALESRSRLVSLQTPDSGIRLVAQA